MGSGSTNQLNAGGAVASPDPGRASGSAGGGSGGGGGDNVGSAAGAGTAAGAGYDTSDVDDDAKDPAGVVAGGGFTGRAWLQKQGRGSNGNLSGAVSPAGYSANSKAEFRVGGGAAANPKMQLRPKKKFRRSMTAPVPSLTTARNVTNEAQLQKQMQRPLPMNEPRNNVQQKGHAYGLRARKAKAGEEPDQPVNSIESIV